jgi:proteasome lid subunit RPN8/RPN11
VRLDADAEPRVTVHIAKSAMDALVDECARCGGHETGGWLVGPRTAAWHGDHNIIEATVAATARTRSSVALDTAAFLAMDEHLVSERRRGKGFDLRAIGDWHSHPSSVATPSENDLQCWARDLATIADHNASLTSLIVTPRDGRDTWARPVVTAWITRHARSSFGQQMVVEPATVTLA